MSTNTLWKKLLIACTLLALLFTTACGTENAINDPAGKALAEQGNVIMTRLKDEDFQAVHDMLSLEAQQALDEAIIMVGSVVDLESEIMQGASSIAVWKFDKARVFTKNGDIRGNLDGRVDYLYGKSGKVHLELEQQDGTWKLRSISLEQ